MNCAWTWAFSSCPSPAIRRVSCSPIPSSPPVPQGDIWGILQGETASTPEKKRPKVTNKCFPSETSIAAWSSQVGPLVDKPPLLHSTCNALFSVSPSNMSSDKDYQRKDFRLKKRCPNQPDSGKDPGASRDNVRNRWKHFSKISVIFRDLRGHRTQQARARYYAKRQKRLKKSSWKRENPTEWLEYTSRNSSREKKLKKWKLREEKNIKHIERMQLGIQISDQQHSRNESEKMVLIKSWKK